MAKHNIEATKELGNFIIKYRGNGITVDNFAELKTILCLDPDPNIEVKGGMGSKYSLLDLVFVNHNYEHIEFVLKNYYLNVESTLDEKGNNIVFKACKENRADILTAVENSGKTHIDYNKANNKGETPLLIALKYSKECFVLLLNDPCIKLNYQFKNLNSNSLLHILCNEPISENDYSYNYYNELFNILINKPNLDINLKNTYGLTPIMMAAKNNNFKFVEAIINYKHPLNNEKVDTSTIDIFSKTAIDYAHNSEIIKLLSSSKTEIFIDKLMKLIISHNDVPAAVLSNILVDTGINLVNPSEGTNLIGDDAVEIAQ